MREQGITKNKLTSVEVSRRTLLQGTGAGALMLALGTATAGAQSSTPVATPQAGAGGQHAALSVYPANGTTTASPGTEISFRGVTAERLGTVHVSGETTGGHSGLMMPHSDGLGVSYVPDAPFHPGEKVTVSAGIPLDGAGDEVVFTVATPVSPLPPPAERTVDAPVSAVMEFTSRPDLKPPVFEVMTDTGQTAAGDIFIAPRVEDGQAGVMIVDNAGELIWYQVPDNTASQCMDFKVQHYRGQPVLVWWQGAKPTGYGEGHYVIANSAYETLALVQVANGYPGGDIHEVLITPRDTLMVSIYNPIVWDMTSVGGAANGIVVDGVIQELDIETGRVVYEWHSLDHLGIEESFKPVPKEPTTHWDYIHFNSIAEDANGDLYISARHFSSAVKISRETNEIVWRLNGKMSDFEMGPGTEFAWQHDVRPLPDGRMTIFDNHTDSTNSDAKSRGIMLALDEDSMRAELIAEYLHPDGKTAANQSNVQVLPNGNVFVGWGPLPDVTEHTEDGELIYHGASDGTTPSYRAYRYQWAGTPSSSPDVVVADGSLYVSWNGATGVASWQVLSGADAATLAPQTTVDRDGFETTIPLSGTDAAYAVQALDADGRVMATSEVVTAS